MTIKNIFETRIYEAMMPNFDSIKSEITAKIAELFNETSLHENLGGDSKSLYWQVNGELHNIIDIDPIISFVTEHAKIYWKELGYRNPNSIRVMHSWANMSLNEGWITRHHHRPVPVVGSFYINANKDMGNLFFEHPYNHVLAYQPNIVTLAAPYEVTHEIEVDSGKLVLFPGYLNHWTGKNKTNETRLGLAFHVI